MQIGREFQCEIEKTVFGGDGLTRVEGEVVFLPRTLPGEKLIGRITAEKKNFSRAEVVRFGVTSPHRVEPACPCFGRCPGCDYLHTDYPGEIELKAAQLNDLLAGAGFDAAPLLPWGAPEPALGYRNKIVLHVHKIGARTLLGYVMGDNTTVTDIESCPLAHPAINEVLVKLRGDKSFLHSLHEGMDVTFRYTPHDGVRWWRNRPAKNETWLREETPAGTLSVPCGSFFQVNPGGMELLANEFRDILDLCHPRRVVDLYSGVGLFAAVAAGAGIREIMAVESDEDATAACRYNLTKLGVPDAEIIAGDAADAFAHRPPDDETLLVVDPPRNGLSARAGKALIDSPLKRLFYISCNPATWARDAARLRAGGFTLKRLRPVNMFPRTMHFELASFWER